MARVLVVDDEKSIRLTLSVFLRGGGHEVENAQDVETAKKLLQENEFDVVVSDIVLPGMSGVGLLHFIRETAPHVQVIMMTGEPTVETAAAAVRAGASDYLTKPVGKSAIFRSVETAARVKTLNDEKRRLEAANREYQESLERMVEERTEELNAALEGTIHAAALTVEMRDPYTAGHQQRVANLARAIATEMALSEARITGIYFAGVTHDLGKISVPAEILSKPTKLSEMEFGIVKGHVQAGFDILKNIQFPWPIAETVLQHHERMDGSGYPRGLSGDGILVEARIVGVADVVEAMASHRPYRAALGVEAALEEIHSKRGTLYDPAVANECVRLLREKGFKLEHVKT